MCTIPLSYLNHPAILLFFLRVWYLYYLWNNFNLKDSIFWCLMFCIELTTIHIIHLHIGRLILGIVINTSPTILPPNTYSITKKIKNNLWICLRDCKYFEGKSKKYSKYLIKLYFVVMQVHYLCIPIPSSIFPSL